MRLCGLRLCGMTARLAVVGLVGLAVIVGEVAAAQASMTAMACCAKTRGECAGVKRPDDCCRGMGHVVGGPTGITPPSKQTVDAPVWHAVLLAVATSLSDTSSASVSIALDFKRPHDPPHLHPFSLLI